MATIPISENDYQRTLASIRAARPPAQPSGVNIPQTPDSVNLPVASPRTPDGPIASYAADLGAASPAPAPVAAASVPALQQTRNMAAAAGAQPGLSPRTPDAAIAAYANTLRPATPVAPAAPVTVQPGSGLDLGGNIRGDIADAYRRGAQAGGIPTGLGMAAREAITSPVSRAVVPTIAKGMSVARDAAGNIYEGVRAFVTGAPPTPEAPAAPAPAPAAPQAPVAAPPATTAQTVPVVAQAPAPVEAQPVAQQRQFQVGNLTVTDQGNARTITDGGVPGASVPAAQAAPLSVRPAPAPGILPPERVTRIPNSRVIPRTALGGAMGAATGLAIARGENAMAQRGFKNEITAQKAADESARTGADVERLGAGTEQTKAETKKLQLDTQNAIQLQGLREKLVNETDPKKRKVLENKIYALQGKKQGNFQVVTAETIDPGTGLPVKTPYIIDADTGQARPIGAVGAQPAAGGQAAAPAGMTYVGKTPDGRKVYKDAQGKNVVEG